MEKEVVVKCRKEDMELVERVAQEARATYATKFGDQIHILIDNEDCLR